MQEILIDFYIFLRTVIVLLFSLSFCHFYKSWQTKKRAVCCNRWLTVESWQLSTFSDNMCCGNRLVSMVLLYQPLNECQRYCLFPFLTQGRKTFTIISVETTDCDFFLQVGTIKRRLPVIPRERNGGLYAALAGNLSSGGDTYDTSGYVLRCFYRLDFYSGLENL